MVWDDSVTEQFSLVNRFTVDESEFYGPYNTLLVLLFPLFPPSDHYQVAPQYKRIAGSSDFTVFYIVMKRKIPIFFLEIKTFLSLDNGSCRAVADAQMRDRFLDFSSNTLPQRKLFGVSAMGTRFALYEYTTHDRKLVPSLIAPHPDIVTDTAPKERWSYDILEATGEAKLKAVVAETKEMASALHGNCGYRLRCFRPFTD